MGHVPRRPLLLRRGVHLLNGPSEVSELPSGQPRKSLGLDWFGQTAASLCWIASVFAYGISGAGDYLQLSAASAWLIANIWVAISTRNESSPQPRTK